MANPGGAVEYEPGRGRAPKSGVNLTRILVFAFVLQIIALAGNSVVTFATKLSNDLVRWIAATVAVILVAMLQAVVEAISKAEPEPSAPGYEDNEWQPHYRGSRPPPRRSGTSLFASIMVVLIVIGIGGLAVSAGAQYATGYLSGKEIGPDALVKPKSAKSGQLRISVEHVYYTSHFTRVELTARNSGDDSVDLPLFGYCVFTGKDGTTLQADSFKSQWSTAVPPGALTRGTVTFPGKLPPTDRTASFSFTQIFGVLGGGAITVKNLALRPTST
jgi:hypothetical protein